MRDAKAGGWLSGSWVAVMWVLGACNKQEDAPKLAPVASALSPSTAEASGKAARYNIEKGGRTSIDMPAPKERIKAETSATDGHIDVTLHDLGKTRGEVRVDLATLSTHTFGDDQDEDQTHHARTWLEVGDSVPAETRQANRWAVFAIRSIDGLAVQDASRLAPIQEGGKDVRVVKLVANGDFLLHGHKVERACPLEVRLQYPAGAPADSAPTSVEIKTTEPLKIVLAEHDVKPRDTVGKLAQGSFHLLGTKVADNANVTFTLVATAAP